jgi:MFS family permease
MAGLRSNRSWTLLLTGGTVSSVGDYVFNTTVVLWIGTVIAKGQSWAPAAVSGVLLAAAIPAIFVGPAAGVFVDRWNRRRIMLVGDACRTVLTLALLPLAWPSVTGHISRSAELIAIYAVLVAASCFSQFFNPAKFAVLFSMVDEADRARAGGVAMSTGHWPASSARPLPPRCSSSSECSGRSSSTRCPSCSRLSPSPWSSSPRHPLPSRTPMPPWRR